MNATAAAVAVQPATAPAEAAPTASEDAVLVRQMRRWALPGLAVTALSVLVAEAFLADWPPVDDFQLRTRIGVAAILHVQASLLLIALGMGTRQGHGRLSDFLFALTLGPMARVVSLALPGDLYDTDLYVRLMVVLVPLFAGLGVLIHTRGLAAWQSGLHLPAMRSVGGILWTVVAALVLPAVAFAQHRLLEPDLPDLTGDAPRLVFYSVILVLVALWQELVFRGVVLQLGSRAVGAQTAVLLSALWFAFLQIGTQAGFSGASIGFVALGFIGAFVAGQQARATTSIAVTWPVSSIALLVYFIVLPGVGQ